MAWLAEIYRLNPRTVCECGVGPMDISIAPSFVGKCRRLLLIEPVPEFAEEARKIPGAEVVEAAIGTRPGEAILACNGGSSFLHGTWSPTRPPSGSMNVPVKVLTFDAIDDGEIDVLGLDCEGQEWAALSRMISRPKLMTVEIWSGNPFKEEINTWLRQNNYKLRFSSGPTNENHVFTYSCTP